MERKFYNAETDEVLTYSQLLDSYCQSLKEDPTTYAEMSFEDYIRNCTDKNGALEELTNCLDAEEENEIVEACAELFNAVQRLSDAIGVVDYDSMEEVFCDGYPFVHSFEETYYEIDYWTASIATAVTTHKFRKAK